ncbi:MULTISPECIES: hypothetical protein [unclassified Streptomyces]|uniref:hypothetical protein n=1 Tax=unclassified Streptomyces TaxID=2593676 RepID=UPI002DD8AC88|nr:MULTISPECIES: hypothetical protein [unclassified Streptomyces]WSB79207.1 hypothetical protein OHB04_28000 [Streptomyces sp. NBC_01775]WSS12591.1 hypothetical protein OG533_12220 [Streptomyces sp. NBC_01186]WSS41377.1 hypothetical protein OG220_12760 [Streptomyces sp. NBC_01187]
MPSAGLSTRRAVQLTALLALAVFYTAQLAGALLPNVPVFVTASLAGLALDLYLTHKQPGLLALLGKVRFDVTTRQLLRDMLIVIGLVRIPDVPPDIERPLTLLLLISYAAHFLCQAVAQLVRRTRTLPVVTRNIDASALGLTIAPPRLLARQPSRRLLRFSVPGTIGLVLSAGLSGEEWGLIGVSCTFLLSFGGAIYLGTWMLPKKRSAGEREALAWLDAWLADYRPTVGMYFSGGTTSAYQANMWLSTLAQLDGKPLIVLRERFMVQKIDATDVPIVCIPKVAHLMHLEHSTLKVLLHPANSGKTSQVLRIPTIKHTFTNHGESDKLSSCNPYAKAYDQVWVAGEAARERYQLAEVGVDDRDVVEVGRPQLTPIQPYAGAPEGTYTTVLYAPTWEGWDGNPGNTSVVLAGENIVRALLADPGVRLLYKPHPMTGSVDPRAGAADQRIRAMITEANAARGGERRGPEAAAELERRTAELDQITTTAFRPRADEMERMKVQGTPEQGRAARVKVATEAWEEAYWASFPEWEHQIVTGPRPAIFTCFNQADLLISDVSSVVSDYLTSEKPYAVANTSGLDEEEFRRTFPTVRAGTVLTPGAEEIPGLLEAVRNPEKDTLVQARKELKIHLLGPSDPPSLARFNAAALELGAEAEARNVRVARRTAEIPGQREADDAAEEAEMETSVPVDPEDAVTT